MARGWVPNDDVWAQAMEMNDHGLVVTMAVDTHRFIEAMNALGRAYQGATDDVERMTAAYRGAAYGDGVHDDTSAFQPDGPDAYTGRGEELRRLDAVIAEQYERITGEQA